MRSSAPQSHSCNRANDTADFSESTISSYGNLNATGVITHADGSRRVRFSPAFVCLSVFFRTISQKPMQIRPPNLTQECSTVSPGNPFILGSRGQNVTRHKNLPTWVLHSALTSSSDLCCHPPPTPPPVSIHPTFSKH